MKHTFITGQFVRIDQQLANVGQRITAAIIDLVMKCLVGLFLSMFAGLISSMVGYAPVVFTVILLPVVTYDLICEYFFSGQSLGKKAMGLKVVASDGSRPSFVACAYRWAFYLLEGYTGFGLVVMLFTRENQRLGDVAAGTYIVSQKVLIHTSTYLARRNQYPPAYIPMYPQASLLSERQVELIGETIWLRGGDSMAMQTELAGKVCAYLGINVAGVPPLQFLNQIVYDYRFMLMDERA